MTVLSKAHRKKILLDPVAEYKKQILQATDGAKADEVIAVLDQLQLQVTSINQQLKNAQDKSKNISRQIGEAKCENRSYEDLLQAMRQHSDENKNLKNQLKIVTDQILSQFKTDIDANNSTEQLEALPPSRIHIAQPLNLEQLSINLLDAENEEDSVDNHKKWNRYVESNPASSLYHRVEWKHLIETVFGHECYYFYASINEQVVGILPLVRLNSRLFGDFMVSMPYFNSGGAIANSLQIEQQLMLTANELAEKIDSTHIEYRDDIRRDNLPVRDEKVNMILSLPDSAETLWQSFSSKLRSQIRRGQREKITVNIGGINCLEDFYTVFAQNMRDLGTPVYGKSFFSSILSTFPENSKIIVIRLKNQPVAAAFLLGHNKILEIPWASTIKNVNHLSINMILYWETLKFAIENKNHYFDFGRSSKNSGTFRFKQQWGAKPKQCYWHYWLKKDTELPSLNPNNPKYKLLINVWKKIPVCVTKYLGPGIVKNLP